MIGYIYIFKWEDDHIKIYKREKDLEIIKKRNRKKEREI